MFVRPLPALEGQGGVLTSHPSPTPNLTQIRHLSLKTIFSILEGGIILIKVQLSLYGSEGRVHSDQNFFQMASVLGNFFFLSSMASLIILLQYK